MFDHKVVSAVCNILEISVAELEPVEPKLFWGGGAKKILIKIFLVGHSSVKR